MSKRKKYGVSPNAKIIEVGSGPTYDFEKERWDDEDKPEQHGPMCLLNQGGPFCTCRPTPE